MKRSLLLCLLLVVAGLSQAQNKSRTILSGTITDSKTGAPLPGASIILSNSRTGTYADSTGKYSITNIPIGHNIVEISFSGYRTLVEHVDLTGNDTKNFTLQSTILVNEGITVTAVGGATSIRKAPIPITRVTKDQLLFTPSTNIIDGISKQPGVSQLSTGPAVSKPVIRGLGYNRLVVINDGMRQEGQQWGDEHGIEIDENSVNRVEIVKGPASLIYGSDAMAGVVNIITTMPAPDRTMRGSISTSYATNNGQRSLFGSLGGNYNGFNWNAWGDYRAAGDYQNKYDGYVFNSKFNEKNFGGYVGYNGRWGYSHLIVSSFNQKLGMVEGERNSEGAFVRPDGSGGEVVPTLDEFRSTKPFVPYQGINHLKFISDNSFHAGKGRVSLNLGWQQNKRKEFGEADAPDEASLFFDLKTFNYNAAYHFNDQNGWNTALGISGMSQGNRNRGEEVLIPEYDLFDIGGYIYSQKTIGRTTVSGGLRYDRRTLDAKGYEENGEMKFTAFKRNFSNVSGSAGVSYAATERLLFKLNLARGFRAPSLPEIASNGTHEGTNRYEYGNQDLKSETSWQGDLGLELNSDHILITANAFYNQINNFIFYRRLSSVNGGDSLIDVDGETLQAFRFGQQSAALYGGEVLIDIHPHPLDWLHWQNTFSYVRGRFNEAVEGSRNIPFIPAARWISELRASFLAKGKLFRNLELHLEADRTFDQRRVFSSFNTETPTEGYTLVNASIGAEIMSGKRTLFKVFILGHNLADVAYQNHLSRLKYAAENEATGRRGVFNMGRNFMFRLHVPLDFSFR